MVNIEHNLKFVTVVDENHPIGKQLLELENQMRITMLEGMLKDLLVTVLAPVIDKINENGSYAILKVAN